MKRGISKLKYTAKQKKLAKLISQAYRTRGLSAKRSTKMGFSTVVKIAGGRKKIAMQGMKSKAKRRR